MLATLQATDPALLREIVRQDQRSPAFELLHWDVKPLSAKGIANPEGLFLFSGQGRDERGIRPWSVVLKILTKPGEEQDPRNLFYWKRELLLAQSALVASLPRQVVVPRYYGTSEHHGQGWLWMEYVAATTPQSWTKDNYAFAAYQLGCFNGAYLTGLSLPDYPWLSKGNARTMSDVFAPQNAWDNCFVQRFCSNRLRERVLRLWNDRERFLHTLDHLPQTFSHFDFSRRNLFIRTRNDNQEEIVAVDWAMCGCGPIGGDLCSLIGTSAFLLELETAALPAQDTAAFEAYVTGLRESGWTGDPQLARLGYTAYLAIFTGLALPALIAYFTGDDHISMVRQWFGCSPEELASALATVCEFALDRADEARGLMDCLQGF
jgi:hypothetical protein